ncbi:O-antigen ligase family protein [Pedobacter hartonius]|uniref:O-Antigen ligase n=1 Tax=Pedobacter hartonius TaxID=425514 RepID=A0A1H4GIC9_9SPHI|nr:O-antigen ligase family protein [Pedobacter hartonius]SEB09356.1 O-Antigen ligase [Pedobacter hartonius]
MQQESTYLSLKRSKILFLIFGVLIAVISSFVTFSSELIGPVVLIVLAAAVIFVLLVFRNPRVGFIAVVVWCFMLGLFGREVGGLPYGMGIEILLLLTWISALVYYPKEEWVLMRNDLSLIFLIWFIINIFEVINPAGASVVGWAQEIRGVALYPILIIPLSFVVLSKTKDLDMFIRLILLLAFIAALNGIKQVHIGLFPGEARFLASPEGATHMIFGKLRAFSFYDAGQFGAFEAVFVLMAIVLALGSSKLWKKILLLGMAGTFGYAMLISGTRGAFFALVVAAFFAIILTKNFKILFAGSIVMVMFLFVLKFTSIGASVYSINRFRTALDPQDPSLNVRFKTQQVLREYLISRPFGGGLGVLGAYSTNNPGKFLSTIQPDSYWVKLWAMTGVVGLTIWFTMMMYVLGKCCGIIWKIQDKKLKVKLIAVFSASAGIFFCSYGNEVINNMPSLVVAFISFVLVYQAPGFDRQIAEANRQAAEDSLQDDNENLFIGRPSTEIKPLY